MILVEDDSDFLRQGSICLNPRVLQQDLADIKFIQNTTPSSVDGIF